MAGSQPPSPAAAPPDHSGLLRPESTARCPAEKWPLCSRGHLCQRPLCSLYLLHDSFLLVNRSGENHGASPRGTQGPAHFSVAGQEAAWALVLQAALGGDSPPCSPAGPGTLRVPHLLRPTLAPEEGLQLGAGQRPWPCWVRGPHKPAERGGAQGRSQDLTRRHAHPDSVPGSGGSVGLSGQGVGRGSGGKAWMQPQTCRQTHGPIPLAQLLTKQAVDTSSPEICPRCGLSGSQRCGGPRQPSPE